MQMLMQGTITMPINVIFSMSEGRVPASGSAPLWRGSYVMAASPAAELWPCNTGGSTNKAANKVLRDCRPHHMKL